MWSKAPILTEKKSKKDWDGIFQESYSVHFYDSSMTGGSSRYAASNSRANKIMRKKIYGQRMPALTYLAEENCPMTLSSQ